MTKRIIKLTESQLKSVVEKVIMEQGAPTPQLAPGQEKITKDGRTQARKYSLSFLSEFDRNILSEALVNSAKQVPMYRTKFRPTIIANLSGLGLKQVNTPGFFKNTGDEGTLTHTFSIRFYYFDEPKTSQDKGKAAFYDVVYNIGSTNPNATIQDFAKSLGLIKNIQLSTSRTESQLVPEQYVQMRSILPAKSLVILIASSTGMSEEYIATWLMNSLSSGMDNQEPDLYGQTGNEKYQSYYQELYKLYVN